MKKRGRDLFSLLRCREYLPKHPERFVIDLSNPSLLTLYTFFLLLPHILSLPLKNTAPWALNYLAIPGAMDPPASRPINTKPQERLRLSMIVGNDPRNPDSAAGYYWWGRRNNIMKSCWCLFVCFDPAVDSKIGAAAGNLFSP